MSIIQNQKIESTLIGLAKKIVLKNIVFKEDVFRILKIATFKRLHTSTKTKLLRDRDKFDLKKFGVFKI